MAPSTVDEDGATNLVYTFTRTGSNTAALTVNFTIGGTADFNTDYTQIGRGDLRPTERHRDVRCRQLDGDCDG